MEAGSGGGIITWIDFCFVDRMTRAVVIPFRLLLFSGAHTMVSLEARLYPEILVCSFCFFVFLTFPNAVAQAADLNITRREEAQGKKIMTASFPLSVCCNFPSSSFSIRCCNLVLRFSYCILDSSLFSRPTVCSRPQLMDFLFFLFF